MPRCPLCRSALVTLTFGLYPIAICASCSARWIQDGHQQRAINQIQEPSLMVQEPSLMAQGPFLASSQPARSHSLTADSGQLGRPRPTLCPGRRDQGLEPHAA
jgi:Zn-finger nucleic acid-binding protein